MYTYGCPYFDPLALPSAQAVFLHAAAWAGRKVRTTCPWTQGCSQEQRLQNGHAHPQHLAPTSPTPTFIALLHEGPFSSVGHWEKYSLLSQDPCLERIWHMCLPWLYLQKDHSLPCSVVEQPCQQATSPAVTLRGHFPAALLPEHLSMALR